MLDTLVLLNPISFIYMQFSAKFSPNIKLIVHPGTAFNPSDLLPFILTAAAPKLNISCLYRIVYNQKQRYYLSSSLGHRVQQMSFNMSILSSMIPSASDSALLAILAHSCFATSIIFSDILVRSDGEQYIKKLTALEFPSSFSQVRFTLRLRNLLIFQ